jgi:hypothetical protein
MVVAKNAVALGQPCDQSLGPRDGGGIRAHDQQQGRGIRVACCVRPQADPGLGLDQALLVVPGGGDGHWVLLIDIATRDDPSRLEVQRMSTSLSRRTVSSSR